MASKRKSLLGGLLKYGIPLVITVGLCWLLYRDFDFTGMWHMVTTQCRFGWIALGMALAICSHIFRAMRWGIQLRALDVRPPFFFLVLSIFGTYAVNLVFPRLGEVWRTGYIAARQHAPFTAVFGSMVADRLADTLTVLLLTLLAFVLASGTIIAYLSQNGPMLQSAFSLLASPWLWAGVAVAALACWWLLRHSRFAAKARHAVRELWDGFVVVLSMKGRGRWLLLTVGIWGCFFLQLYVALFAFPFTEAIIHRFGLTAVLVTFVLSSISMGVPSNGGIGPWQWAVIFGLGIYGLDRTSAATFANLVLGCNTLLLIVLGIFTFTAIAIDRRSMASQPAATPKNEQQKINTPPTRCQK